MARDLRHWSSKAEAKIMVTMATTRATCRIMAIQATQATAARHMRTIAA